MIVQDKIKMSDLSGGQCNNLNITITPQNTVDLGLNVNFDYEIGSATSRFGREIVGAQLVNDDNPILGLHQHIDTDTASNNKLFATLNASGDATSVIYDVVAGTTSQTGLTAGKKMRFLTFNGATLGINGADAERSYTNAGWITTGGAFDLANIPSSNKVNLCTEFLDRVYVAGDTAAPTRLYYSGVSDGSTVSWTVSNGFVDIEPESGGGPITALAKVPGYVLIFKERSLHRWNFNSAFPEGLIQVGTPSQESVIMAGGLCAFYSNSNENAKGFYITNGDRPIPISHDNNRPIKKWVDAITTANEANIGGYATDRGFAWSVGDVTVDGEAYANVVLRYNRLLNQWSVHSYPSQFRVFAQYLVSGVNTIVGGDEDGTVFRVEKTDKYQDDSTPIHWKVRQQHNTFGTNKKKTVTDEVVVRGKNIEGATVCIIPDEDLSLRQDQRPATLLKKILSIFGVKDRVVGTTLSVEIAGETKGARAYIREIELTALDLDENYL